MAKLPEILSETELVLQRLKVGAQQILPPQIGHDLEWSADAERTTGRMVLRLRSWLYADKLVTHDAKVEVTPRTYVHPPDIDLRLRLPQIGTLALATVAAVLIAPPLFLCGVVVVLLMLLRRGLNQDPIATERRVTVTVPVTHYATFPDTKVYPDELGDVVRYSILGEPEIEYGEVETDG